jgi:hypothetical protein
VFSANHASHCFSKSANSWGLGLLMADSSLAYLIARLKRRLQARDFDFSAG